MTWCEIYKFPEQLFLCISSLEFKLNFENIGVSIEFRAMQDLPMQIAQNLLLNETDNKSSFCH